MVDMGSLSAAGLLGRPVLAAGGFVGHAVDLLLDGGDHVLGFVVEGGDGERFLPYGAAQPGPEAIAVPSELVLVADVTFYREHGRSFRSLLGTRIDGADARLVDVRIGPGGEVVELELDLTAAA
jgi:hypothetical protein